MLFPQVILPKMGIKGPLSWRGTPTAMMGHNVSFAIAGIMAYVAFDGMLRLNPI